MILTYEQAADAGPASAGGKGHNLGLLARFGLPVPHGFVVSADVYRAVMATSDVASRAGALAPTADVLAAETIAHLDGVRAAIHAAPWPAGAADALADALRTSNLENTLVAVRSSATAEDSLTTSFAGIHDSTLDVVGVEGVRAAIAKCWASLWTPRAVAYRRHHELSDADVAAAVVVCAMVRGERGKAPRAAGVAMTCDPRSGRRDHVVVSAVEGLADGLVSGRVTPFDSALSFRGTKIDLVSHQEGSPLSWVDLERLARLCLRVHWAFGDGDRPQDIEWVHDGTKFVLVQARPVVRPPDPRPAALHAWPVVWSNANIKDAVPVVLTTLGWSMLQSAIGPMLYLVIEQAGADVPGGMPTVRRFGGRAFFDITLMQWLTCHCFGIPPVEVTRTMGGAAPELPIDPKSWTAREKLACGGRGLRIFRRFLRLEREFEGEVRRLRAVVQAEAGRDVQAATTKQLGERLRELGRATSEFQEHFMIASSMSGAWTQQLNEVLGRAVGERASSLASGLLAGTGGVESAEHGYGLIELARLARGDEAARSYLTARPRDPAGWRALPAGPFREAFAQYLEKFGHRSVYEADLANPRWAEDPSYLLDQIEALLGAPEQDRAAAARGRRAAAESELEQLPFWWRVPARWLARKAATGAGTREAAKSALSLGMLPTRRILVEVGRRLAESGKLESAHDVFELAVIEIDGILREEWDGSGARTLAGRRKAQRARWLAEAPPPDCFVVGAGGSFEPIGPHGEGLPEGLRAPESAKVRATDGWLPGLPLSAGTARGTARVIRHPEEGLRLQHGEVLVAPSTDPAWTPLFLRASALVMETGGYLSHGAIVAREYGLPAVANVPALFEHVTDGRSLTVDGGAGRIKVES